jgi:hydroxymethylpyrimidine/phosphomethylpyrimidine kinase
MPTALTIAGSDSSGGAGIQADLKTFAALGVYGLSVITAVTAQNTCEVSAIREMDEEIVTAQLQAIFTDIPVQGVKIGMLVSGQIIQVVANLLHIHGASNIVVDPVMIAKSGRLLLQPEALAILTEKLFPLATVVTPNLEEAAALTGIPVHDLAGMKAAAVAIKAMGPRYVVIKGGHLPGAACDLLYDGQDFWEFVEQRIPNSHTHGTGCTFSSAIAASLAKGMAMPNAVGAAKKYVSMAISHGFPLGKGIGPTHHFFDMYCKAGFSKMGGE